MVFSLVPKPAEKTCAITTKSPQAGREWYPTFKSQERKETVKTRNELTFQKVGKTGDFSAATIEFSKACNFFAELRLVKSVF